MTTPETDRRGFLRAAAGSALALTVGGMTIALFARAEEAKRGARQAGPQLARAGAVVIADPSRIPPPIRRGHPVHHEITLEVEEIVSEIAPGARFRFQTFGGQVPGPMLRVRRGDTIAFTLKNPARNVLLHSIDMHAIYGTGGGAAATAVLPGSAKSIVFKAAYPGFFIYHCAVPEMDMHIASGMYGAILVEPERGLAHVDREFYLGQNEVYTVEPFGTKGQHKFDQGAMVREQPTYVLLNGAVNALTVERGRPMRAKVGETVRVFLVNGGPNLLSSFHPIGNVWSRAWPQGALANRPLRYVQTQPVAPGSTFVGEMELPLAETIKLVDHALSRVLHQGLLAEIVVAGKDDPSIFKAGR